MRISIFDFRFLIAKRIRLVTLSPCHLVIALALLFLALPARAQTTTAPATAPHVSSTVPFRPLPPAPPKPGVVKDPAPTTAVDPKTCTTEKCHPEVKDYKVVHGPVNVNACDACHKLTDAATHKYEMTRPANQSCTFCHKMDTGNAPVVHQPVKTGDCLPCHNPHGGKTAKFIRSDNMLQVCSQCHQDVVGKKQFVHGPVASGACEACHSPHTSKNPKLLVEQGKTLCLTCHKEMGDKLKAAKVTHKPVMDGECSQCHDPHASNFKMQVKADPFNLCTSCHEHDKIKQAATDAKFKHSIVQQDQACLNCHTPHGGPLSKLMKAQPVDVCIKCHQTEQKAPDGHAVKAVPEITNPALTRHGPVKDGTCSGCHNPHGSDTMKLLAKPYPETFYAKFDPENFALCFTCHDKKLVETKEAEGLTGFRNGTQNLHFVHVDKEKGRTCRACHEVHASPSPVLIRFSVPFGQWDLPLNYKKNDNGGSCAPGCHKEYGYDRKTPVNNGTGSTPSAPAASAPATAPSPGIAIPGPTSSTPPTSTPSIAPAPTATPTPPAPTPATIPAPAPSPTTTAPVRSTAPASSSAPGTLNLPK